MARSGDAPWYGGTPPYFKSTTNSVTFQNITVTGGRSSGTPMAQLPSGASSSCSQGTELDGGGGAIFVRDMILHVINSKFISNHGPVLGPDVAGGAIYAMGSLDVTIQGSVFQNNDASNGGAVGVLVSDLSDVNNVYSANRAVGHDGNFDIASSGCPVHLNQYQVGSGGNAGAVYLDGQANARGNIICGAQFLNNAGGANAEGGAIFAVGDPEVQSLIVAESEFDNNQNYHGGALYMYLGKLIVSRSSFVNNRAAFGGAIETTSTQITGVNNTFANNSASTVVGTIAALSGSSGVFLNNTFSGNTAPYFPIVFPGDSNQASPNLVFVNNIFANNRATGYPLACHTTFSGANNVLWPFGALTPAPEGGCAAGQVLINPQLAGLADNGGGVLTMPLPAGNPARFVGATNCPDTDERGVARPSVCAAGAYQP